MKKPSRKHPNAFVLLAVILATVTLLSGSSLSAPLISPSHDSAWTEFAATAGLDNLTEIETLAYRYLNRWHDQLTVSEILFGETVVLQLYLTVTTLDDALFDNSAFSAALFDMLEELKSEDTRVYLDILNRQGERLEGYEFKTAEQIYKMITYNRMRDRRFEPDKTTTVTDALPAGSRTYVVQSGDSWWTIATRFYGRGSMELSRHIAVANGKTENDGFSVGDELIIPPAPTE